MKNKKSLGRKNQRQGTAAEKLVMNKLKKSGWTIIPTDRSRSPIDIFAYNKKKSMWWGIQVKSSKKNQILHIRKLSSICNELYLDSILAFVKIGKMRNVTFCKWKNDTFYHVYEDGIGEHIAGESKTHECIAFEPLVRTLN